MTPSVSVVVITRDRPGELTRSLRRLVSLPDQPRVVVVDNGSAGRYLPQLRREFPEVQVLALPANRGAAARTTGARVAATEYVAFADDDSWWAPGALERAVTMMEADARVGLVAGRVVVEPDGRDDPTAAQMATGPLGPDLRPATTRVRAVMGCMACGAVVRTRAYLSVGGFPLGMGVGGEEQLLIWDLWAAGWRAVYVPDVVAHHHPSASRNPAGRRRTVTRNDLWSAWARLSLPAAASETRRALRNGRADPVATGRGLVEAVARADWAATRRARLPGEIQRAWRCIASGEPVA